ncbi:MAG: DUF2779 domain-containing protein [Acidiferrobacterales bacterium]
MAGIQCPKQLYLKTYHPEFAEESAGLQDVLATGHKVGELARTFYPNGRLIGHDDDLRAALEETSALLTAPGNGTLFEATVQHDGVLVRTDVLEKGPQGVRVVEVKSSTGVKDHYIHDCAIQAWVLQQAGYPLERIELAHIDNTFVYAGDGNYEGLLKHVDLTAAVRPLQEQVAVWVNEFKQILAGPPPQIEVDGHCKKPYECPFLTYCTREHPEYPVTALPNGGRLIQELLAEGIEDIREIPEGRLSNALQERVRRVTVHGETELDPEAGEELRGLAYPRYYLDFETVGPAIPIWGGTRPYQSLPFQWSCHIEYANGELCHAEFLDTTGEPPMRALAEKLLAALGDTGPIFTYTNFEQGVVEKLADMFPDLAGGLKTLVGRLIDLHKITNAHYYHPAMRGSWSLKAVLPTIAPDLRYDGLGEVQEGNAAGRAYFEIIDTATDEKRRKELTRALIDYCKLDTLALVRLAKFLQQD